MADAASPLVAPVLVQLDRERALVLDFRALFRAETRLRALTGKPDLVIFDLIDGIGTSGRVGLTELAVLLWAGLSIEDPHLTEDALLLELSSPGRLTGAVRALTAAINAQFNDGATVKDKEDGAGEASRAPFPRGTSSGPPGASTSDSPTPSSGG